MNIIAKRILIGLGVVTGAVVVGKVVGRAVGATAAINHPLVMEASDSLDAATKDYLAGGRPTTLFPDTPRVFVVPPAAQVTEDNGLLRIGLEEMQSKARNLELRVSDLETQMYGVKRKFDELERQRSIDALSRSRDH